MRRGLVVAALMSVLACRTPSAEAPRPETVAPTPETALDEHGWSSALDAAKRGWASLPDDATSLAFVLDDHVTDASEMRIVRARVEFDGRPITLGGESPRVAASVIGPGTHLLSFTATVVGPPCVYCAGPGMLQLERSNLRIDVTARTAVVVRIGAAAPGSPTTSLEERLRLLVETRAWRRLNDRDVGDIARETADRCIDEATREVEVDRVQRDIVKLVCHKEKLDGCRAVRASIVDHERLLAGARARGDADAIAHEITVLGVLQRTAADTATEIPYCI